MVGCDPRRDKAERQGRGRCRTVAKCPAFSPEPHRCPIPPAARPAARATLAAASIALLVCAIAAIVAAPWAPRRRGAAAWSAVVAAIAVLSMLQGPMWYLNRWAFENVVQVNLGDGMRRMYGPETLQRLRDEPPPARVCETGLGRRMNVIVLVVESWSMHHSRLFSGLQDLTPRLDAIARRGSWYPRFRTNGFSTEGGLAALLTGSAPLSGIRYGTIMLFTDVEGDLHRRLRADGFDVRFLTTGGLDFTQRERWLELIGIDDVEGAEHPAYDGRQRGSFGAASDAALMRRVLQWYDDERGEAPFVATVLTVGMHAPFVPLDGAEAGERGAVRAADAAIGDFVDALDARGFFEDGLLFVSGDHRVMQPVTRGELEIFGDDALVRVPAFVVGAGGTPPGPVDGDFQQVDLVPSLQYLLTAGEGCRSALHGRMFGPSPVPAPVQVFADPMRYDQLRVVAGGRSHLLVLDGDDSRWDGPAPPPGPIDPWLEVARLRVGKDKPPAE